MAYSDIKDPSAHFQATVYTGNNTAGNVITNTGNSDLKPDLIFSSYRTSPPYTNHRCIIDSTRGRRAILESDTTAAEVLSADNANVDLQSINTDGFTVGQVNSTASLNAGNTSTVAWQWKANGGTTASNTDGTITSTVQANTDAGFSIYTYTGTGAAGTVGHGLGGLPEMIILKGRNTTSDWPVYVDPQKDGTLQFPKLNGTDGNIGNSPFTWDTTKFTFSSASGYSNTSGTNYIAYAFRSIQGYSKIGSYVGNGNANGSFIYTGFKPAVVINKRTDSGGPWTIFDNARCPNNVNNAKLYPHTSDAEVTTTGDPVDFLSNGYKLRGSGSDCNVNGGSYIFIAFAEHPFVAGGVPTTAR